MANTIVNPQIITDEQAALLIESVYDLKPIHDTAAKFGFKTRSGFDSVLRRKYPELVKQLAEARIDSCVYIEDKFLTIMDDYDFKMAKVALEVYSKVLSWRIPAKYSQRIDMNINQTVSITHNLAKANDRMSELMRNVVPVMISDQAQDKTEA